MKLTTLLPILLSLPSIHAKGHNSTIQAKGHNSTSTASQCHQISLIKDLISVSSNATKLAAVTHNDTAKASAIQASASAAASTLATLEANSTLTSLCDQVFAADATRESCHALAKMERTAALAANTTTSSDKLKTKAAAQASELAALQGNATLTTLCAGLKTTETCQEMNRLQKMVDGAADGKNATRTKARVEKAQAKLDELKGNATLVAACGSVVADGTNNAKASTPKSASEASSSLWPAGNMIALLTVFMSAVLLL